MERIVRFTFFTLKILEIITRSWWMATYTLFLEDRGLKFFAIMVPNILYHYAMFLFDPPTGYLGDRFGHVKIYIIGCFFYSAGMLTYFFSYTLSTFLFAEFVISIGASLMSAALEAWTTNLLGKVTANKMRTTLSQFRIIAIFGAVLGAYLGDFCGREYTFLLSSLTIFGSGMIGVFIYSKYLKELDTRIIDSTEKVFSSYWHAFASGAKRSVKEIYSGLELSFSHKEIRKATILSFFTSSAYQSINMLWAIIFADVTGRKDWLGWMWVGITIFETIGVRTIRNINHPSARHITLVLITIGVPIALFSVAENAYLMIFFFLLHQAGRMALREMLTTYTSYRIPDRLRALMMSSQSSMNWAGGGTWLIFIYLSGAAGIVDSPIGYIRISAAIFAILTIYSYSTESNILPSES